MPPPPLQLPHAEPGLLMAHGGQALVVQLSRPPSDATFRRHVDMLEQEIDQRRHDQAKAVMYDAPTGVAITAIQRKMLSEMLVTRIGVVRKTTAAYAMSTPSPEARGALRAVFWQAPPPYPWEVVASTLEAFTFFKLHLPEIDPETHEREYRRLLLAHKKTLEGEAP